MKLTCDNPQNQMVRECIFTALMILMEKKSFSEISITEIAKKAGVSRMSYYRNYNSKEDIINMYLDEMLETYLQSINNDKTHDRYQRKYMFLKFFENNQRLIKNLVDSGMSFLILNRLNRFTDEVVGVRANEQNGLPGINQQDARFAVGGLYNVIIGRFYNGTSCNIEEIAGRLCGDSV